MTVVYITNIYHTYIININDARKKVYRKGENEKYLGTPQSEGFWGNSSKSENTREKKECLESRQKENMISQNGSSRPY